MEKEIIKEYSNGELTVVWKPKACIHSKECIHALPNVYKPEEKPWITPENATTQELKDQIAKCPSGALSYYMNKDGNKEMDKEKENMETKVEVKENGPLLVHGNIKVKDKSGNEEAKKRITAFCRCGSSKNKPYCDGTHNEIKFQG